MRYLRHVVVLVAVVLFAGCEDLGTTPTSTSITIVNQSATRTPIGWVYIASCSASSWGPDQLGNEVITPDVSKSWGVEPGCYNVRVEMLDDDRTAAETQVNVQSGEDRRVTVYL